MRLRSLPFQYALGALLIFAIAGCSGQKDVRLRYEAERKLDRAERFLDEIRLKNDFGNSEALKQLHTLFDDAASYSLAALDSVSPSASPRLRAQMAELAFQSSTRLSQALFSERSYDSCLTLLTGLKARVKLPPLENAVIWVNLGQAYQAKGQWDSAVSVFNNALALTDPPLDEKGNVIFDVFNLPAHMYSIYDQIGDSTKAASSFNNAISYYRLFTSRFPGTRLGLASFANLAALYVDRQLWPEAVDELSHLKDSTGQINWEVQIRMADILAGEMHQYDSALALYDGVPGRLKKSDTLARPIIIFKKSLVLMQKKQYDNARLLLTQLNQQYPAYFAANPTAQLAKAKSFDDQNNWERAETEYRFLIENYAESDEAMSSYLYVGDQLARRGRTFEAERWNSQANGFYQQIADKHTGTPIEAKAMTYQAELLRRDSNWTGAVNKLTEIFRKFPNLDVGQRAAIAAATLTRDKIGDTARAESIISELKRSLTAVEPPAKN